MKRSYGIIAQDQIGQIIFIRRKASLEYIQIVVGKWNSLEQVQLYLENITIAEKKNLLTKNFNDLWNGLWYNKYKKYSKYQKMKFDGLNIRRMLLETNVYKKLPEVLLPKGQIKPNESEIECATREFMEETGISKNFFEIDAYREPVLDTFRGTDNNLYQTVYYFAKMKKFCNQRDFINYDRNEVSQVLVLKISQALSVIDKNRETLKGLLYSLQI
jgi:NUDIX domain